MLTVSFVPLVIFVSLAYWQVSREITSMTSNQLTILANEKKQRINLLLERYKNEVTDFSNQYELKISLNRYLALHDKTEEKNIINALGNEKSEHEEIISSLLLDTSGHIVARDNGNSIIEIPTEVSGQYLEKDMVTLVHNNENDKIELFITNRIYFEGKILGAIVQTIDTSDLEYILSNYTGLGKTGEVVLAKKIEGGALVLNDLRLSPGSAFHMTIDIENEHIPVAYALSQDERILSNSSDYRQHKVIAVTRFFDHTQWGMVLKIDQDEALSSVTLLRNILFGLLVITLSVSTVFILYFIKKIISPVSKLTTVAKLIYEGDLSQRADITSKDEIGTLADTFNKMADKVQESTTDLNQKVESKTKELLVQNESLEKGKLAMMNLLEDARALEEQLKEEKEGVEKKVEERTQELSQAKAKLDSSIENLPLGFLMVDIEEKVIVTNSLTNAILDSKEEKKNLASLKEILKPHLDLKKYIQNCDKERKRLNFSDIEINSKIYQFLLSPILTSEPQVSCIGVVILIQDITEAKILDRSKDEFFSIASHELRTPLTAIRGNTSMILEYYADAIKDPELKAMIDDVHESSIRLINIVNDFLNIGRLEQGKMVYDIKEVNLEKIIPETIKEYDVTGSRKKIGIEYLHPPSPLPQVLADVDKVRQVLINLLGNALKFTDKGGVKISTEVVDKFVKVIVTDTGRGIPHSQQNLLFHKFQQASSSLFTRDTVGGTGLGLYISKMMIQDMMGELKLEHSETGKGSAFSFTLPTTVTKKDITPRK